MPGDNKLSIATFHLGYKTPSIQSSTTSLSIASVVLMCHKFSRMFPISKLEFPISNTMLELLGWVSITIRTNRMFFLSTHFNIDSFISVCVIYDCVNFWLDFYGTSVIFDSKETQFMYFSCLGFFFFFKSTVFLNEIDLWILRVLIVSYILPCLQMINGNHAASILFWI